MHVAGDKRGKTTLASVWLRMSREIVNERGNTAQTMKILNFTAVKQNL